MKSKPRYLQYECPKCHVPIGVRCSPTPFGCDQRRALVPVTIPQTFTKGWKNSLGKAYDY